MVNGKVAYAVTKDPIHRDAGDEGGVTLVAHPHPRMVELSDAEVAHIQRVYETYMEKCAHLPLDRPPLHLRLDFIRKKATPEIPDGDPRLLRALEVEMQPSKHWKLYMEYLDYVAEGRRPPLRNVDPNAFANFIQAIIDPPELRHSREQTAEVVEGVDVVSPDDTRELD
jgi:hypothetical protein